MSHNFENSYLSEQTENVVSDNRIIRWRRCDVHVWCFLFLSVCFCCCFRIRCQNAAAFYKLNKISYFSKPCHHDEMWFASRMIASQHAVPGFCINQAAELTLNILYRKLCKNWSTSRCRLPTLQSHAAVRGPWAVRDQDQPRHQAFSSPGTPAPSPLQPRHTNPLPSQGDTVLVNQNAAKGN